MVVLIPLSQYAVLLWSHFGCAPSCRFGLLDLRFWWGSPRPRSASAEPTEALCAPSLCVTGKRNISLWTCLLTNRKHGKENNKSWVTDVDVSFWMANAWCLNDLLLLFSGSSVLSWLRSRRSSSRCSRHRHRARNLSKLCICIATIKKWQTNPFPVVICSTLVYLIERGEGWSLNAFRLINYGLLQIYRTNAKTTIWKC